MMLPLLGLLACAPPCGEGTHEEDGECVADALGATDSDGGSSDGGSGDGGGATVAPMAAATAGAPARAASSRLDNAPIDGFWTQVSVGIDHACALDLGGALTCWNSEEADSKKLPGSWAK